LLNGLTYELLDHYLGLPRGEWPERYRAVYAARLQAAAAALAAPAARPAQAGPSLPLARYAGAYSDQWFGTIRIGEKNGVLDIAFPHWPGVTATLEHWQYDTFRVRFSTPLLDPAFMTFALGAKGDVERITVRSDSPAGDLVYQDLLFTPAATP
jgi:hypothetical protein